MRVTLIHNPQAGDDDNPVLDELLMLIRAAGHSVTLQSSKSDQLEKTLEDPGDLLAVAGGDGTVGAVACRLIGRRIPIAVILPLGTANKHFSEHRSDWHPDHSMNWIAGWASARRIQLRCRPGSRAVGYDPLHRGHGRRALRECDLPARRTRGRDLRPPG